MLSEEQMRKLIEDGQPYWWNKKALTTGFICLLTAIFGGLTVWSINGTYKVTRYYVPGNPGSGSYEALSTVDPTVQGLLAFLTLALFFFSFARMIKAR